MIPTFACCCSCGSSNVEAPLLGDMAAAGDGALGCESCEELALVEESGVGEAAVMGDSLLATDEGRDPDEESLLADVISSEAGTGAVVVDWLTSSTLAAGDLLATGFFGAGFLGVASRGLLAGAAAAAGFAAAVLSPGAARRSSSSSIISKPKSSARSSAEVTRDAEADSSPPAGEMALTVVDGADVRRLAATGGWGFAPTGSCWAEPCRGVARGAGFTALLGAGCDEDEAAEAAPPLAISARMASTSSEF